MKKALIILGGVIALVFLMSNRYAPKVKTDSKPIDDLSVNKILEDYTSKENPWKVNPAIEGTSVERGKELVKIGVTSKPSGGKTKRQSKHFVCTSCHNIQNDLPDLAKADPNQKLDFAIKNNIPFLQGSTFYGIVNRTNFYNGDYQKKYGDVPNIKQANTDLREAIQICATVCAQGRRLKDWELESILAYFWTLELKIKDLKPTIKDYRKLEYTLEEGSAVDRAETVKLLTSKFLKSSPATFSKPPEDPKIGYGFPGDKAKGKFIYEQGCLHCHGGGRYSMFILDSTPLSLRFLKNMVNTYGNYSIYHVSRYGTKPHAGKKAYMPQYPLEKMDHHQLEDLRAYLESRG